MTECDSPTSPAFELPSRAVGDKPLEDAEHLLFSGGDVEMIPYHFTWTVEEPVQSKEDEEVVPCPYDLKVEKLEKHEMKVEENSLQVDENDLKVEKTEVEAVVSENGPGPSTGVQDAAAVADTAELGAMPKKPMPSRAPHLAAKLEKSKTPRSPSTDVLAPDGSSVPLRQKPPDASSSDAAASSSHVAEPQTQASSTGQEPDSALVETIRGARDWQRNLAENLNMSRRKLEIAMGFPKRKRGGKPR